MSASFQARRLGIIKRYDERLLVELGQMAVAVGDLVQRAAVGDSPSKRIVPNTRAVRERLSNDIWNKVVRPYFIGPGDEPFSDAPMGTKPQVYSPYAKLIFDGVEEAIDLEAERQVQIINKFCKDPVVLDWLTGPRPFGEMGPKETPWYDPFHKFVYEKVDGTNYQLSDAVWDTAVSSRERIDKILAYQISRGRAAVDIAEDLEPYLTTGFKNVTTNTPYGQAGNYAARRLARTEITAGAGRAYVNAALVNPYISGTKWNTSASHPDVDICDSNASGGPKGDGVYAVESVPTYPAHPHCLCYLTPQAVSNPKAVTDELRGMIEASRRENRIGQADAKFIRGVIEKEYLDIFQLRGAFNDKWIGPALKWGEWVQKVLL